jgi:spore germination cell wall hydrolase CwlJ-like protein
MDLSKYTDIEIAASTICAEAGGEPFAGQVMVGETIANRAIQSGMSIRAVCLAPKQFSCWNNRGTMWLRMQTMRKHPAWADCVKVAETICKQGYKPVSPVTHYYAFKKINMPAWAESMKLVSIVGGHYFLREET